MNQGMMNTVVSAIVGGVVGAAVVFFAGGKEEMDTLSVKDLKVGKLSITEHAFLLNKDGKEEVAIKDGSVMVENLFFGRKFMGQQFQGAVVVANRVLSTPDNMMTVPMNQWKFYAELGSNVQSGGELVVRSVAGPAMVNVPPTNGALFRMGFDTESNPQMLGLHNPTRSPMQISQTLSERQRQEIVNAISGGATQMPGQGTSVPLGTYQGSSEVLPSAVATQPDSNNPMR